MLERSQWINHTDLPEARDELAAVINYCYQLAKRLGPEPDPIVLDTLAKTLLKHPAPTD